VKAAQLLPACLRRASLFYLFRQLSAHSVTEKNASVVHVVISAPKQDSICSALTAGQSPPHHAMLAM
jgi:hypothetical protein